MRSILALAAALLAAALVAPATLATGGATPGEETTTVPEPTVAPEPTPTPWDGNGEIVIDPTFIIASPTPDGAVQGATGAPDVTPPPTDTLSTATTPGTGLQVLLVLGVGASLLATLVGRPPARRRP